MSDERTKKLSTFDFTLKEDGVYVEDIIEMCDKIAKNYVFQLESSENDYLHFQGRFRLKVRDRITKVIKICQEFFKNIHISITNTLSKDDDFYVMKEDTRVDGPWSDQEKPIYVPIQIKESIKNGFRPFQQTIIDSFKKPDFRKINIVVNTSGNIGKSIVCNYLSATKKAMRIPFVNDYKDIMRMVMCMPKVGGYLIDMPKAINKEKLYQLYAGIETIKDGYAYDDRYTFKYEHFDSPIIWVFTNMPPDMALLSNDRWSLWQVNEKFELVEFLPSLLTMMLMPAPN